MEHLNHWGENTIQRLFCDLAVTERFLDQDGNGWWKHSPVTACCEEALNGVYKEGDVCIFHTKSNVYYPRAKPQPLRPEPTHIDDNPRSNVVQHQNYVLPPDFDNYFYERSPEAPDGIHPNHLIRDLIASMGEGKYLPPLTDRLEELFQHYCILEKKNYKVDIDMDGASLRLDVSCREGKCGSQGAIYSIPLVARHPDGQLLRDDPVKYLYWAYADVLIAWLKGHLDIRWQLVLPAKPRIAVLGEMCRDNAKGP